MGQNPSMPFELERYPAEIYARSVLSGPFNNEDQALETYLSEYKRQRATDPANYFPPSTLPRKNAAGYILIHFPKGESAALIQFLETEGSQKACSALLQTVSTLSHTLPYRFLAAYLLKNKEMERLTLLEMKQRGMLSEFLVAFGENMINSARDADAIITNGFQDLIAFRAAQLTGNSNTEIPVYNLFVEKCKAFSGTTTANILGDNNARVWVSPVMSIGFLSQYENNLWTSGIGFTYNSNPHPDPELPIAGLLAVATQFEMPVVDPARFNPSLKGLAQAYTPFLKSIESYVLASGSAKDRKKVREITEYLEPFRK